MAEAIQNNKSSLTKNLLELDILGVQLSCQNLCVT